MIEWRRHTRVKEEVPVRWSLPKECLEGQGIVRNVSISGLLLEVEARFTPAANAAFIVEVADPKIPKFIPKVAMLVWSEQNPENPRRKFCGLKFVDPTGAKFTRLKEHIDSRLENLFQATDLTIINRYLYQSN
jgi:hypothetical protein